MLLLAPVLLAALAAEEAPRQVFERAAAALARGEYDQAEKGFQQVLRAQPGHIGALGNLGVVYNRTERFDLAVGVYQRALKLAPGDAGLLLNLGLALLKQNRYAEARAPLEKLAAAHPAHRQGQELLATALLYSGATAEAIEILERLEAGQSTGGVLFLLALGRLKQGDKALAARALERLESSLSREQAAFLRGKAYYESGLFEEAAKELEPAAASSPDARRELGKVYVSLRKGEEAETQFRQVLRERAGDAEASYFLGALLVQRDGEIAEGVRMLSRARDASPAFWGAHYYLGRAALKERRTSEALGHLGRAAELKPDDPSILYQLLRAHQAAGDRAAAARISARLKLVRERVRDEEQAALVLR